MAILCVSLMAAIWRSHLALSRKIDRQGERIAAVGQRLIRIEGHIAAGSDVAEPA